MPTPVAVQEEKKIPYTGLPTENPNSTIVPGQMRSDREELPSGFTKEQADRAEVREFELQQRQKTQTAARAIPQPGPDCQQYWPSENWVCGAIRDKYNALGAQFSFLTFPTSEELVNPDGFGRRQTFQNGPMYWSASSGAHPVANHFFAAWQRNGWESGVLKYPTTDEIVNPDGVGRRQEFQGGVIYWRLNDAYYVGGLIRQKWDSLGSEAGALRYPVTDERVVPKYSGRFNDFENGSIYWSPNTGVHNLYKPFTDKWQTVGRESGVLGYVTQDEQLTPNGQGRFALFETGSIYQKNGSPAPLIVRGSIKDQWASFGYETGKFGFPLTDEYDLDGGRAQDFEGGTLVSGLGPQPSDFDDPSGTCPATICTGNGPSVSQPSGSRSAAPDMAELPTCSDIQAMPEDPNPNLLVPCRDESASARQQAQAQAVAPADSAVQPVCYDESPNIHIERLYACRVLPVSFSVTAPGEGAPNGGVLLTLESEARTNWNNGTVTFRQRYIVENTWGTMVYAKLNRTGLSRGFTS